MLISPNFYHSYYAKLKRLEEERQKELAEKYRDRARERRDGNDDQGDTISTTADYRAVAPDAKSVENLAERRKQVIQESKYLGGDMEHTHLVKGMKHMQDHWLLLVNITLSYLFSILFT
jgi:IK cytokine